MAPERNLGDYIAGFVDGEGCFSLTFRKDIKKNRPGAPVYYAWRAMFAIEVRKDDDRLIQILQQYLDCGSISYSLKGNVRYQVSGLEDLRGKLIPFFDQHPLLGKKGQDYGYWKSAVEILHAQKGIQPQGETNAKLEELHKAMRPFKASSANKPLLVRSAAPSRE